MLINCISRIFGDGGGENDDFSRFSDIYVILSPQRSYRFDCCEGYARFQNSKHEIQVKLHKKNLWTFKIEDILKKLQKSSIEGLGTVLPKSELSIVTLVFSLLLLES